MFWHEARGSLSFAAAAVVHCFLKTCSNSSLQMVGNDNQYKWRLPHPFPSAFPLIKAPLVLSCCCFAMRGETNLRLKPQFLIFVDQLKV